MWKWTLEELPVFAALWASTHQRVRSTQIQLPTCWPARPHRSAKPQIFPKSLLVILCFLLKVSFTPSEISWQQDQWFYPRHSNTWPKFSICMVLIERKVVIFSIDRYWKSVYFHKPCSHPASCCETVTTDRMWTNHQKLQMEWSFWTKLIPSM